MSHQPRDLHDLTGPIWLDVTRLTSRLGRGPLTGIDRVERAYLDHLVTRPGSRFFLRSTRGYLLLARAGGARLADLLDGAAMDGADLWSRLSWRGHRPRHRAEASLRPFSVDRAPPWGLAGVLRRQADSSLIYLNTGHANLSRANLSAFADRAVRTAVMVHDLIPITHPDLVSPAQRQAFPAKIDTIRRHSDVVLCNSSQTRADLEAHWAGQNGMPMLGVAPLGVPEGSHAPTEQALNSMTGKKNGLIMIGTLDPRKNHAVVLDALSILAEAEALPQESVLHIVGSEGWQGEAIAAKIRAHPLFGRHIRLETRADDAAVARLLAQSHTLLFPSLAEGFGLPPWEALRQGVLPICADLPVLREMLGNSAVYLDPRDAYSWAETIKKRIVGSLTAPVRRLPNLPTWQEHFAIVAASLTVAENGQKGPQ